MKRTLGLITALTALSTTAFADVTGVWATEEGETGGYAIVMVTACEDDPAKICGTITDIIDNENRESVGKPIILDMEDKGNGKFRGGKIYAPDQDKWYNSRMVFKGDVLAVYGCVAGGLICRGQDWSRIE